MSEYTHWVAVHGNATSIIDQKECTYAKNMTLRYPVRMVFDGDAIRFRFSNLTGTEPVTLEAQFGYGTQKCVMEGEQTVITKDGDAVLTIEPGQEIVSDEIAFEVVSGKWICVSLYMKDYTCMNAGVLITGKLSGGFYSYGDHRNEAVLPLNETRNTNWYYFLNTVDVHTKEENHAFVCYGDSITAQDWPDDLAIQIWDSGIRNVSIIRRAVSGTRVLREYHCTTYAAYGLKGETRFPIEMNVAGASAVLLQHGINDIIHPVGVEVNPFRPMSDMPTVEDLAEGFTKLYIEPAKAQGLKVYGGTLLPIKGWRTYEPFREEVRDGFNEWLRHNTAFDGIVDFDHALMDENDTAAFKKEYDSGDHLHPSKLGYETMALEVNRDYL